MPLFGSSSSVESKPLTSAAQRKVESKTAGSYEDLLGLIGRRLNTSNINDTGINAAKNQAISNLLEDTQAARGAFTRATTANPTFTFNYSDFNKEVSTPLMTAFRENIAPLISQQVGHDEAGKPGSFYSANVAKAVGREGTNFYNKNVLPAYLEQLGYGISAAESAETLRLQGAAGLAQLPMQTMAGLTDIQSSELQALIQALSSSGQFATTPTMENIVTQSSGLDIGGIASGGLGGYALGSMVEGMNPWASALMGGISGF